MYAVFEDTGKILAGRILSQSDSASQIELDTGKRLKVKAAQLYLRFEKPEAKIQLDDALALSAGMDVQLAWEFAPDDDFGFVDLAKEYFSEKASTTEQIAALLCLHNAPHYFRRLGKGQYKKAPAHVVQQALLAIEKKKQQQEQVDAWANSLLAGVCPDSIRSELYKILFKPDKNSLEYKAVVQAVRAGRHDVLGLLRYAKALGSDYEFHWQRFLFEHFPKGLGFEGLSKLSPLDFTHLPLSTAQAFSIDDSATTEIDDALSVQGMGTGHITVGIHIAAPSLAIKPGEALDAIARQRLSTVYMPGNKITMLPADWVTQFSLDEGAERPAISLYATLDETTLECTSTRTVLERICIAENLRHDVLDEAVNDASIATLASQSDLPFAAELAFLHRWALQLKAEREIVRGKPELFNRPDYSFQVLRKEATDPLLGNETVVITERQRGAPLDLIVAESMIFVNSQWGQWLDDLHVPAIYRSQASLAPGIKVRMGSKALPHAGMGVACYTWASSPLRRYVDLLNQWQLLACVQQGNTAALAAPFKAKDTALLAVISAFDAAYTSYNAFQRNMECYWTLQYLAQHQIKEASATVMQNGLARLETLPLVVQVAGVQNLTRGSKIRIALQQLDTLNLVAHGQLLELLDTEQAPAAGQSDAEFDLDETEVPETVGLQLAIELDEPQSPTMETSPTEVLSSEEKST